MKICKALVCESLSEDLSGVVLKELELPDILPKQILIKVKAASVNFPDLLMTQGKYQHKPDLPFVLGMEGAGVVEDIGSAVVFMASPASSWITGQCLFVDGGS